MLDKLKQRAGALKKEVFVVYFAARDPRTPWFARAVALLTVAYALSPIDLIPDFVPVLGYLDDLIIVPAGITLAIHLIPAEVLAEAREQAASSVAGSVGYVGLGIMALVWIILLIGVVLLIHFLSR